MPDFLEQYKVMKKKLEPGHLAQFMLTSICAVVVEMDKNISKAINPAFSAGFIKALLGEVHRAERNLTQFTVKRYKSVSGEGLDEMTLQLNDTSVEDHDVNDSESTFKDEIEMLEQDPDYDGDAGNDQFSLADVDIEVGSDMEDNLEGMTGDD